MRAKEFITEAFDQPYSFKWEKGEESVDALAQLPDGSNLSIMFNQDIGQGGDDVILVEFYRNNSQEVTGEGDAQRIFATVLAAIQQYINKYKPQKLIFSAMKDLDPYANYGPDNPKPNPESRAKLYDRLVQRYAQSAGYSSFREEHDNIVRYQLTRLRPAVTEGKSHDFMAGHCHVMAIALKQLHPDWQIRAHVGWDDDEADDTEYRVDHVYTVAPDGTAYDCRGRFDNEQQLVGPDTTGGVDTQYVNFGSEEIKQAMLRGELKRFSKQDLTNAMQAATQAGKQGMAEGSLNEASSDEAWELVGQPVPEIQQFVKQMGYGNDEQSIAKITSIIDRAPATQISAASIPKLKNLANKGNDAQTLKSILQISGRPDAEQQYTKLMQARDAGEGRNRDVSGYIQYVKSGNYDPPVLLKLPTGVYVIGGRTRLYAALALGVPANVKIISANNFKQGVAEDLDQLSQMFTRDQAERNEFKTLVKTKAGGDYVKGGDMYAQLKNRPRNDIFGGLDNQDRFMKMKFDFDKFTNDDWDHYWMMALHSDQDRDFQRQALATIEKYEGQDPRPDQEESHYQYLYDRISCGTTGTQKYGTQDICNIDSVSENFADGRNPQDKGDSKRHGINTKASVSSLRKTAKQGGRKGQLAHWLANMKSGRAKKKKTNETVIGTLHFPKLIIAIDDHAIDRTRTRGISPATIDQSLRKLNGIADQLGQMESSNTVWVYDVFNNLALGLRRTSSRDMRFTLKTVVAARPFDGTTPIIELTS